MRTNDCVFQTYDISTNGKYRSLGTLLTASLFCLAFFALGTLLISTYKESISGWGQTNHIFPLRSTNCKYHCRPFGSESLPKGIVENTSNFELRALWDSPMPKRKKETSKNLLAVPVGIKQKELVNKIIKKFLSSDFTVMLFHYDGVVDQWKDLEWNDDVLHVSVINQTKWWFAKRFLHPDIVADYDYIFLWDEDLGVENFNPGRYLSIIKSEGLEISQPALDPSLSEVHHRITVRGRRSRVHRRFYKSSGGGRCYQNSTEPPCTGWVEMMAPVFSKAAWRCTWYMIQNDLVHAWGLDMKLGYCSQGDRTKKVGVVDSEYIVHHGIPTLGGLDENKTYNTTVDVMHIIVKAFLHILFPHHDTVVTASQINASSSSNLSQSKSPAVHNKSAKDRLAIRKQSFLDFQTFKERWERAVREDECWIDPYPKMENVNLKP